MPKDLSNANQLNQMIGRLSHAEFEFRQQYRHSQFLVGVFYDCMAQLGELAASPGIKTSRLIDEIRLIFDYSQSISPLLSPLDISRELDAFAAQFTLPAMAQPVLEQFCHQARYDAYFSQLQAWFELAAKDIQTGKSGHYLQVIHERAAKRDKALTPAWVLKQLSGLGRELVSNRQFSLLAYFWQLQGFLATHPYQGLLEIECPDVSLLTDETLSVSEPVTQNMLTKITGRLPISQTIVAFSLFNQYVLPAAATQTATAIEVEDNEQPFMFHDDYLPGHIPDAAERITAAIGFQLIPPFGKRTPVVTGLAEQFTINHDYELLFALENAVQSTPLPLDKDEFDPDLIGSDTVVQTEVLIDKMEQCLQKVEDVPCRLSLVEYGHYLLSQKPLTNKIMDLKQTSLEGIMRSDLCFFNNILMNVLRWGAFHHHALSESDFEAILLRFESISHVFASLPISAFPFEGYALNVFKNEAASRLKLVGESLADDIQKNFALDDKFTKTFRPLSADNYLMNQKSLQLFIRRQSGKDRFALIKDMAVLNPYETYRTVFSIYALPGTDQDKIDWRSHFRNIIDWGMMTIQSDYQSHAYLWAEALTEMIQTHPDLPAWHKTALYYLITMQTGQIDSLVQYLLAMHEHLMEQERAHIKEKTKADLKEDKAHLTLLKELALNMITNIPESEASYRPVIQGFYVKLSQLVESHQRRIDNLSINQLSSFTRPANLTRSALNTNLVSNWLNFVWLSVISLVALFLYTLFRRQPTKPSESLQRSRNDEMVEWTDEALYAVLSNYIKPTFDKFDFTVVPDRRRRTKRYQLKIKPGFLKDDSTHSQDDVFLIDALSEQLPKYIDMPTPHLKDCVLTFSMTGSILDDDVTAFIASVNNGIAQRWQDLHARQAMEREQAITRLEREQELKKLEDQKMAKNKPKKIRLSEQFRAQPLAEIEKIRAERKLGETDEDAADDPFPTERNQVGAKTKDRNTEHEQTTVPSSAEPELKPGELKVLVYSGKNVNNHISSKSANNKLPRKKNKSVEPPRGRSFFDERTPPPNSLIDCLHHLSSCRQTEDDTDTVFYGRLYYHLVETVVDIKYKLDGETDLWLLIGVDRDKMRLLRNAIVDHPFYLLRTDEGQQYMLACRDELLKIFRPLLKKNKSKRHRHPSFASSLSRKPFSQLIQYQSDSTALAANDYLNHLQDFLKAFTMLTNSESKLNKLTRVKLGIEESNHQLAYTNEIYAASGYLFAIGESLKGLHHKPNRSVYSLLAKNAVAQGMNKGLDRIFKLSKTNFRDKLAHECKESDESSEIYSVTELFSSEMLWDIVREGKEILNVGYLVEAINVTKTSLESAFDQPADSRHLRHVC